MKKCSICEKDKPLDEFYTYNTKKGIKYYPYCKECKNKKSQLWYSQNKDYHKELVRNYYDINKDNIKQYHSNYFQQNKSELMEKHKQWKEDNPERTQEIIEKARNKPENKEVHREAAKRWRKTKLKTDVKFRISHIISNYIRKSLKDGKQGRHWEHLVGFTVQELMEHLEPQFKEGMNWNNYGEWHIDHIKPISSFNYETFYDEEFKKCWSLENLQPLWALENILKSNKLVEEIV